eukprot:gene3607-2547_t
MLRSERELIKALEKIKGSTMSPEDNEKLKSLTTTLFFYLERNEISSGEGKSKTKKRQKKEHNNLYIFVSLRYVEKPKSKILLNSTNNNNCKLKQHNVIIISSSSSIINIKTRKRGMTYSEKDDENNNNGDNKKNTKGLLNYHTAIEIIVTNHSIVKNLFTYNSPQFFTSTKCLTNVENQCDSLQFNSVHNNTFNNNSSSNNNNNN